MDKESKYVITEDKALVPVAISEPLSKRKVKSAVKG
jgi:hypothetical protein